MNEIPLEDLLTQPENAEPAMLVTPVGSMTLVRSAHSANAESAMVVTLDGMMTLPTLPLGHWMSVDWVLSNKIPSALLNSEFSGSTVISVRLPHPRSAELTMSMTLEGMLTLPAFPPGHWMSAVWFLSNSRPLSLL